ncbi:hypothetical protein L211DRAFT_838520 [Terfezia boudieri ATCC MYA-4762]|uniref:Uncharacterized protein n=1 Tax=Terfezia boudieri ATCC MYA-4762 TaxID=1051890 RepID=A0A3N4LBD1_9PEZI|nr:hypothetical protein L211DRAFT_844213 [Terfezia boudieri ATCC MYA-4762]RPB23665.1 hypothetical protein L211DRAFT_838520 [Terfezia boudieri ATCC MYA-4762]
MRAQLASLHRVILASLDSRSTDSPPQSFNDTLRVSNLSQKPHVYVTSYTAIH